MRPFALSIAAAAAIAMIAVVIAAAVAGCGAPSAAAMRAAPPSAFAWLKASAKPPHWRVATTPSGARLAYPAGWHTIRTDAGTASAAPSAGGVFAGYLNATPQGGTETLANWRRFRIAHVAEEGAHGVRLGAGASGLHFRGARGSCVIDSYSTSRARFREIACIVAGRGRTSVVVAAAPVRNWAIEAPLLRRAVATFTP